ncbi:MAG: polyprenyl synthetase family protein [Lachnospiraceae bacterium]|nr:polyprenyl synthetase family protein [Lachnospiraceae bacterium]
MEKEEFLRLLKEKSTRAEQIVLSYLPEKEGPQAKVYEAMGYSLAGGGKRLRPVLMRESFSLFSDREEWIHPFMAAIEMIHTYSLIHDDLPEMDNDDLRRGRATNHIVYGQAMALLAGDGLLNLAFETVADALQKRADDPAYVSRGIKAFGILSQKAGCEGMLGGQVADMLAEAKQEPCGEEELLFIHAHKTSALLQAPLMIGTLMGGATPEQVLSMERIGYRLGLAFQIRDDILDVTGSEEMLGKPIGSDEKNAKSTYVSLYGLQKAGEKVKQLSDLAREELSKLSKDTAFLEQLFSYLTERDY